MRGLGNGTCHRRKKGKRDYDSDYDIHNNIIDKNGLEWKGIVLFYCKTQLFVYNNTSLPTLNKIFPHKIMNYIN